MQGSALDAVRQPGCLRCAGRAHRNPGCGARHHRGQEEGLRESEPRYSVLFANKISTIAHCKIITDPKGAPVDYRILQVYEVYERIIGITKAQVERRTVREVFPGYDNHFFDYIDIFGKIALEGGEASYETFFEPTRQYFAIYVYSPSPGEFTAIFTDITEEGGRTRRCAIARVP